MGGTRALWRAREDFKGTFFCMFLRYLPHRRAHGFWTLTRACALMVIQNWFKIDGNCQETSRNCKSSEKTAFLRYQWLAHTQNARAGVYARNFLKCLEWPETYSYLIKKWFGAFENFTHAQLHHAYAYARAHIFKKLHNDLKFHVMTYEIVMIIIQRDIIDMLNSQNGV